VIYKSDKLKREVLRKSLHCLIAFAAPLAEIGKTAVLALLSAGAVLYAVSEILRLKGKQVPVFKTISLITMKAARARDTGFVWGPITLAVGAILSLLLFQKPILDIAIYSLALGDGLAGLVGQFGRLRPVFLKGKSIEGSLTCLAAVFVSAFITSGNWHISLAAAVAATLTEAFPLKDYDNIAIPLVVGFLSLLIFIFLNYF
jgi:dolichol kinase